MQQKTTRLSKKSTRLKALRDNILSLICVRPYFSVKANPCAEGDDVPPASLPNDVSVEERISKEHQVFDRITNEICNGYLTNFKFHDREAIVKRIPCNLVENKAFGDKELVEKFLKSSAKKVRIEAATYRSLHSEFKDLLLHVDRRKYEVTFFKCDKCSMCLEYISSSRNVVEFMNAHHDLHFEAKPTDKDDHFMTFLEQEKMNVKPIPNLGLPSRAGYSVGSCTVCPSWNFNSKLSVKGTTTPSSMGSNVQSSPPQLRLLRQNL